MAWIRGAYGVPAEDVALAQSLGISWNVAGEVRDLATDQKIADYCYDEPDFQRVPPAQVNCASPSFITLEGRLAGISYWTYRDRADYIGAIIYPYYGNRLQTAIGLLHGWLKIKLAGIALRRKVWFGVIQAFSEPGRWYLPSPQQFLRLEWWFRRAGAHGVLAFSWQYGGKELLPLVWG